MDRSPAHGRRRHHPENTSTPPRTPPARTAAATHWMLAPVLSSGPGSFDGWPPAVGVVVGPPGGVGLPEGGLVGDTVGYAVGGVVGSSEGTPGSGSAISTCKDTCGGFSSLVPSAGISASDSAKGSVRMARMAQGARIILRPLPGLRAGLLRGPRAVVR